MAPQGFYNAPASKGLVGVTFSAAVFAFLLGKQKVDLLGLDISVLGLGLKAVPLRLLTSQIVFASTGELVFGLLLLYNFRQFEQHLGTLKFVQYIALSMTLSVSAQIALLVLPLPFIKYVSSNSSALNTLASGPYSIIFSLFAQYVATVPKLRRVKLLGAEFSEKSLYYLVGAQLLFSRGRSSLIVGVCGFLSGLVCMSGYLPYQKFRLPGFLIKFGENYLHPILKSEAPGNTRANRMAQQLQRINAAAAEQNRGNANARGYQVDRLVGGGGFNFGDAFRAARQPVPAPVEPPSEEHIETLVAMGFVREDVVRALRNSNNDVNRAAEQLLGN